MSRAQKSSWKSIKYVMAWLAFIFMVAPGIETDAGEITIQFECTMACQVFRWIAGG